MIERAFHLILPARRTSCAVFSSPHSGRRYPLAFQARAQLDMQQLRSSEDAFVDELVCVAPEYGAPLIAATLPRAYVDLNRAESELDPAVVHGAPRGALNARITAGLGVIPRVVAEGREIMNGKITLFEAESRLARGYRPYHNTLRRLLTESLNRFGESILFDCHSMPIEARKTVPRINGRHADIVLGDRHGMSCTPATTAFAVEAFTAAGFNVARNLPFAGGYITQSYGKPQRKMQALQIEIDRGLYMDAARLEKLPEFGEIQARICGVVAQLARHSGLNAGLNGGPPPQLAAE